MNEITKKTCPQCGWNEHYGDCQPHSDIVVIDRALNPIIDFVKIIIPTRSPNIYLVTLRDKNDKEIGFVRNINIILDIRNKGYRCKGERYLIESRKGTVAHIKVDAKGKEMTEEFECPCVLDIYELGIDTDAAVTFEANKNPSNRQLKDVLGCRICGQFSDVMFNDKDGIKCERHRGQTTEILMLDNKGL